jgi:hypothetical protein
MKAPPQFTLDTAEILKGMRSILTDVQMEIGTTCQNLRYGAMERVLKLM